MSTPLTILIDADACPVKEETYRVASRFKAEVRVVSNSPFRIPDSPRVKRVVVGESHGSHSEPQGRPPAGRLGRPSGGIRASELAVSET